MARPPMSKFFSTISTDAPFSRAAIAATSPPAPAPITTTSTSRSQAAASAACAAGASATATTAAPEARNLRRSIAALGRSSMFSAPVALGDFDIGAAPLDRLPTILESDVFAAAYGGGHSRSIIAHLRQPAGATYRLSFHRWLAYRAAIMAWGGRHFVFTSIEGFCHAGRAFGLAAIVV